ncbi:MAG: lysozyme, partial [Candidatus Dojkabacteria bacterium]
MKTLQYLVIHCTATPAGRAVTAADIRRWHL